MSDHQLKRISPVWGRSSTIVADYGEGIYLYDTAGRRYMDFTSGIGVTNTGHAHPRVVQAVQNQAAKILHAQVNIVYHEPLIQLTEELSSVVPSEQLDTFFFSNSGAEAVEAAVKLAKTATGKPNIIVFQGSFHGRTHAAMAMTTSKTVYRGGYQPLIPGIFVAPFPDAYAYGWDEDAAIDFSISELKRMLVMQTAPTETAAMVIEPILGEGGYVPAPDRFLRELRHICNENDILLIADEVQTGFGRAGKWFAVEYSGVKPDIMIMAKGLASGLPLSGIAANHALMEKWPVGSHGGTYGGNAVACAASVATIQVLRDEQLIERSARMGELLVSELRRIQADHPDMGDVRGRGLMVAIEFTTPDGEPWGERAKLVAAACLDRDLMLLTCGPYGQVIRWIPPLIVTEAQLREGVKKFEAALA